MRYRELDFIRGLAIILMIFFHISFDLNNFHFIHIDIYNHAGRSWFYFRMVILTLFMVSVGISLALVNEKKINIQKAKKRFLLLSVASAAITFASYITFPTTWIYFGVLHFVTFASIAALAFIHYEWFSLGVGMTIIILFNLNLIDMHWLYNFLHTPLHLPQYTEDLVPLTPWFGVVLLGIFIGKKRLFLFPLPANRGIDLVTFLGKHSLAIYLIHQPIFFGLIAGASFLLH